MGSPEPLRVIVAAGGTGGHFYPGLAVYEALQACGPVTALFTGSPRGIEARVGPALGLELALTDVKPLNGVSAARRVEGVLQLPVSILRNVGVVRRFRPDVVLSVGGYTAGAMVAAAVLSRVPLVVIEPNAHPGMTHRIARRAVSRAFVAFDESRAWFGDAATRVVGVPVRRSFLEAAARKVPRDARPSVLVMGGSQGARAINAVMPEVVRAWRAQGMDPRVVHQTGRVDHEQVVARYASLGVEGVEVVPFIDDVAAAMSRAHVVVARAGAATVAELLVLGRVAVFVPLPTAADDHQRLNAEAIAARGAGECLVQSELSVASLSGRVAALLADPTRLASMEQAAAALGRPSAAADVAAGILELTGRHGTGSADRR